MILFVKANLFRDLDINYEKTRVFNLSSFIEGIPSVPIIAPREIMMYQGKQFDLQYAMYLLSVENVFFNMMQCIIEPAYKGYDIILLVTMGDGWDKITESFQKFIQQRYNLLSYIIEDISDMECIDYTLQSNVVGVYNLNQDLDRYRTMAIKSMGMQNFMNETKTKEDIILELEKKYGKPPKDNEFDMLNDELKERYPFRN